MKNFSFVFFITLILIFIINLLIVVAWPTYSKLNQKKHSYIKEQIQLLNLNEEDLIILYNETWKNYDKFRFVPFIGHSEKNREGKFLNFTEENGRKVNRPEKCKVNYYFYGGSTTFGYNVIDNQTISEYLQQLLGKNGCVYNHGRAYFYSKQENNLFINHIENGRKIDFAIFLDGLNERCGGYEYARQLNTSFDLLTEKPFMMWKISLKNFIFTLPVSQFINSVFGSDRWIQDENNNILSIESCDSNIGLNELFQSRLDVRDGVCLQNKINCFSFLQPMPGSHGVHNEKLLSKKYEKIFIEKYKLLSKASKFIDLGYVLENDKSLSYIDAVHYSPESNKKIAQEIFKILK